MIGGFLGDRVLATAVSKALAVVAEPVDGLVVNVGPDVLGLQRGQDVVPAAVQAFLETDDIEVRTTGVRTPGMGANAAL